jgi:predicted kinase
MRIQTRLVIIEGIMGSGKSTTARWIAAQLEAAGLRALAITERVEPHPPPPGTKRAGRTGGSLQGLSGADR